MGPTAPASEVALVRMAAQQIMKGRDELPAINQYCSAETGLATHPSISAILPDFHDFRTFHGRSSRRGRAVGFCRCAYFARFQLGDARRGWAFLLRHAQAAIGRDVNEVMADLLGEFEQSKVATTISSRRWKCCESIQCWFWNMILRIRY